MADNVQDTGFGAGTPESNTREASAPIGTQSTSYGDSAYAAESPYTGQASQSSGADSGSHSKVAQKASKFGGVAKEKLFKQADQQLERANQQLRGLTERLERVAQEDEGPEKKIFEGAVSALRTVSSKVEGRSSEELFNQASRQMKEHPLSAIAGFFALGFIGARLVKG